MVDAMKPSGPRVSVVTVTYNERENIQLFVEKARESLRSLDREAPDIPRLSQ